MGLAHRIAAFASKAAIVIVIAITTIALMEASGFLVPENSLIVF
jgi:hypothetical protein